MSAERARVAEVSNEEAEKIAPLEPIPAPATPVSPPIPWWKALLYFLASVMFFLTQGLGLNLALANLTQIQGTIAATTTESAWLSAAYMAPNVSLAIGLVKIRMQYGVRNFAEISIIGFIAASLLNLFVSDLQSAIVVRFLSGIAAAPLSTLGFLYMLEAFQPAKKLTVGVSLAMMNTTLAAPLTRLVSPSLLDFGEWRGLYTLEMALALLVMPIIYLLPLTAPPRVKVINFGDIGSYLLIAVGFGCQALLVVRGALARCPECDLYCHACARGADRAQSTDAADRRQVAADPRKPSLDRHTAGVPLDRCRADLDRHDLLSEYRAAL